MKLKFQQAISDQYNW